MDMSTGLIISFFIIALGGIGLAVFAICHQPQVNGEKDCEGEKGTEGIEGIEGFKGPDTQDSDRRQIGPPDSFNALAYLQALMQGGFTSEQAAVKTQALATALAQACFYSCAGREEIRAIKLSIKEMKSDLTSARWMQVLTIVLLGFALMQAF
jgi:hypothetical protein